MAAPVPSGSTPPEHFSTVFTNAKAGMEGVDKAHVARVVYEMSKGSAHFAEQQRRDAQTTEQVARLEARAEGLDLGRLQVSADRIVAELDGRRKLGGLWACVDMDAFFAAVEELKDPTLREIPFAVGGIGMICTTNYVARRYGMCPAMCGSR
jgi:DNA polymerase kappa